MFALPRSFVGFRPKPPEEYHEKGLTNAGRGPDYEGAIFADGTVAVHWLTGYRSTSVWETWADFWHVHGHSEYETRIEFSDGLPAPLVMSGD
jgi:hypothetical protein